MTTGCNEVMLSLGCPPKYLEKTFMKNGEVEGRRLNITNLYVPTEADGATAIWSRE